MFEVTQGRRHKSPVRIVTAMTHRADASWFYKLAGDSGLSKRKARLCRFPQVHQDCENRARHIVAMESSRGLEICGARADAAGRDTGREIFRARKSAAKSRRDGDRFSQRHGRHARQRESLAHSTNGFATHRRSGTRPNSFKPLNERIPDAILVDMTNNNRRLIGAIVPRGGQWFFLPSCSAMRPPSHRKRRRSWRSRKRRPEQ